MTKIAQRRLLTAALVLVSALALARLIMEATAVSGGPSRTPATVVADSGRAVPGTLAAAEDPQLRLDVLKDLDSRPLPDFTRNPFEFGPTPEEIKAQQDATERAKNPPVAPPPPPPPPVQFKAMGYQQDGDGQRIAYLSDDQDTYVVHQGQQFGQRFKVLKITDTSVEVEDESYHQIVQLPYPQ
ncbi:MAG TPA: hypothetical protein VL523_17900 [Terriglobia bacterium]|nr:hypothetical protein [Terriglobia bacterium]